MLRLVDYWLLRIGYQSSSYLTDRVLELGFVDLLLLFADNDQRARRDGRRAGQALGRKIEDCVGYRILGWFENGFRQISNRLLPVGHNADLAGMRIRVLPSGGGGGERYLRCCWGVAPMYLDLTEAMIDMIKAGTIDAQEIHLLYQPVTYGVHTFHRFHTRSNPLLHLTADLPAPGRLRRLAGRLGRT